MRNFLGIIRMEIEVLLTDIGVGSYWVAALHPSFLHSSQTGALKEPPLIRTVHSSVTLLLLFTYFRFIIWYVAKKMWFNYILMSVTLVHNFGKVPLYLDEIAIRIVTAVVFILLMVAYFNTKLQECPDQFCSD